MNILLGDVIQFRDDKLFQGAVNLSWFYNDRKKAHDAASRFVFHGPRYHGVSQEKGTHEHKLTDTASFACSILTKACGRSEVPFKMAVAGYGTGKSHLALSLAELLHAPQSNAGQAVLNAITAADAELGQECRILLNENSRPSLVIALNGMSEFSLMSETMRRVTDALHADGHDSTPIEQVRPRFGKAATLIERLNQQLAAEICREAGMDSLEKLVHALREEQDEAAYKAVAQYLNNEGVALDTSGGGSLPELFQILVDNYCGKNKPYKSVVILFDEFGKYLEFAIGKPYLAGTNALQELFEAVQGCSNSVCFVGFIQYELKSYLQRLNAEYRNEAQRYITRYDNAEKVYLSTNLETLIANLIEKKDQLFIEQRFARIAHDIETTHYYLRHFFPAIENSATWQDKTLFTRVICQGCWPLSPYALWFIYSLAANSRFLQGRSALSLLKDLFNEYADNTVESLPRGGIAATSLLSTNLLSELIASEKSGNQGAVANAFESVLNRHRDRLDSVYITLLKAVVVASKLIMKADDKDDAINGIVMLSGLARDIVTKGMVYLQTELNLIEWDQDLCCFDILGDAIPKTQFINFIKQRRLNEYDDNKQATLFVGSIDKLTSLLLNDIDTDFGSLHNINTREWRLFPKKTNINFISPVINEVIGNLEQNINYDTPKGSVIYCYAGHEMSLDDSMNLIRRELRNALKQENRPVFVILLHDADNQLGTILAEYDILQKLDKSEKEKFANLVPAYEETLRKHTERLVHDFIKERHWVTAIEGDLPRRLSQVGTLLFEKIYTDTIPFTMDGFAVSHGNGPATALSFAKRLFYSKLDYSDVQDMTTAEKGRANAVLKKDWGAFSKSGGIQKNPGPLQHIFRPWDEEYSKGLSVADMFDSLIRPPFGVNAVAALLILGVYLAGRSGELYIKEDGDTIAVNVWAQKIFDKKKIIITKKLFGDAFLYLAEGSTSKWTDLLDEWDACSNYYDLVSFIERSNKLKKICPFTKPEEMEQFYNLTSKTENAIKEINQFDSLKNKSEDQLATAEVKNKYDFYIYSAVNFGKLYKKIVSNPECWPSEYLPQYEKCFADVRQLVITGFHDWLQTIAPTSDTIGALASFKTDMGAIEEKLRAIKLDGEADELRNAVKKSCRNIEIVGDYRAKMRHTESWLRDNIKILSNSSLDDLRTSRNLAKQYSSDLAIIARNKPLDGLNSLREQLSKHLSDIECQIKNVENRISSALNPTINSIDDLQNTQIELTRLERFCDKQNARDISDLKFTIDDILRAWKNLRDNYSQDTSTLNSDFINTQAEINEQIENKELMLDADRIFKFISSDIANYRKQHSHDWINNAKLKSKDFAKMTTNELLRLHEFLRKTPPYLTDEDNKIANKLFSQISSQLEQQKVAWIIQEFSSLSKAKLKILLDKIKEILNQP